MEQNNPAPDYSFLEQKETKTGFFTSADKKTRIIIVAAGGGILLLFISLMMALIFGGGTDMTERFVNLAQRQEEITRIADIGTSKARSQQALNIAITTKASVESSQRQVISNVASKGRSLRTADLRLLESQSTTTELESAEQANRFDAVFVEIMQNELASYIEAIRRAADEATGNDLALLQELFDEAVLLHNAIEDL